MALLVWDDVPPVTRPSYPILEQDPPAGKPVWDADPLPSAPGPGPRARELRRALALALHLARREAAAAHRWTLLGWTWPLARQLAQLAVLVFAFSAVFDLGIENFPVFVFAGLVGWSWFSSGLTASTWSVLRSPHLVLQPTFPTAVLPLVAVTIPLIDVLVALPVLGAMLIWSGSLHWTLVLLPLLLAVQFWLMLGLAWLLGGLSVFFRDVPSLVGVVVGTLFYLTPVFYPAARVPERYRWVMDFNPMAVLLEAYRDVLLEGRLPDYGPVLWVLLAGLALSAVGYTVFRRLAPGIAEEL